MIILINHALDLDGLGSQAILKKYFEKKDEELNLFYAIYPNFIEIVRQAIKLKPKKIIIADIGFNESFKEIFSIFKKAVNKGIQISWFDHHLVDSQIQEQLKQILFIYINDPQRCASQIVYDYFLPNNPIAKEIADYAYDADFNEKKFPISQNLQMIIAYNRENIKNLERIVDLLSKGKFNDYFIKNEIKKAQKWKDEQIIEIEKNYKIYPIENGKNLVISFARFSASRISRTLETKYPNNYLYMGFDERTNEVVIRSKHYNCRDIAISYGGGGHIGRAGFSSNIILIKNEETNKDQLIINEEFTRDFIKKLKF